MVDTQWTPVSAHDNRPHSAATGIVGGSDCSNANNLGLVASKSFPCGLGSTFPRDANPDRAYQTQTHHSSLHDHQPSQQQDLCDCRGVLRHFVLPHHPDAVIRHLLQQHWQVAAAAAAAAVCCRKRKTMWPEYRATMMCSRRSHFLPYRPSATRRWKHPHRAEVAAPHHGQPNSVGWNPIQRDQNYKNTRAHPSRLTKRHTSTNTTSVTISRMCHVSHMLTSPTARHHRRD